MPKYLRSKKDRLVFQRILFGRLNVTRTLLSLCQLVFVHITLLNGFNNEVFINLEVQWSLEDVDVVRTISAQDLTKLGLHIDYAHSISLGYSKADLKVSSARFDGAKEFDKSLSFKSLSSGEDRHGACPSLYTYSKYAHGEYNQSCKGTYSLSLTG
jgi:hypothetical protein